MNKFQVFGLVLASLTPLMATTANAQGFDLLGTYQNQRLLDTFCANNPHLRNHEKCRYYYRRNPSRVTRPNTTITKRSSVNSSPIAPQFIQALQDCNNSYISGYVAGRRAYNLPIPSQMLQRAQQCGAISSKRLEELLSYQRGHYQQNPTQGTRPNTTTSRTRSTLSGTDWCVPVIAQLLKLQQNGVTRATVKLPGGDTMTDSPDDLLANVRAMCS